MLIKKIMVFLVLGLAVTALLASGCTAPAQKGDTGGVSQTGRVAKLVVGTTQQVTDTNINDYYYGILMLELTHQGLVRINSTGDFAPELAKSWETQDMKRWTFHLVDNATWHDGQPVTALDVKFTIEYLLDKIPTWKSSLGSIESVEAPDNETLVIILKSPDYNFMTNIAVIRTLPEHVFRSVDDPTTYSGPGATTGSGPYVFQSFDKAAGLLTFTAYDKYWGGKPAIDAIEVRLFKNTDTMIQAFQKGEIDVPYTYGKGLSFYYVPRLLQDDGIGIMTQKDGGIGNVLWFNTKVEPYDETEFRQAIGYALDYGELKNLFTAGYGTVPSAGFVPEGTLYYKDTRALSYDVNRSKAMLDALGFRDTDGDGIREMPDGSEFKPELMSRSDVSDYARAADMLKKYFNAVGLDLQVRLVDQSTLGDTLDVTKQYQMALTRTTYWGMMMGEGYGSGYVDTRYYGWTLTNDSGYQSIVDGLGMTIDGEKRKTLAGEIQDYYAEEMPAIAVYSMDVIQPYSKKYTGYGYTPLHGILCYDTLFNLKNA